MEEVTSESIRERVSRMAGYYKPRPDIRLRDVWEVFEETVDAAERCARGLKTTDECNAIAASANQVSAHFGDIAACAPMPDEDPNYDDAAVKIGSDLARAAACAASVTPGGNELCVRVVATIISYDEEAYYEGAHNKSGVDLNHPHRVA